MTPRTYRPVLDDRDMSLIITSLGVAVEDALAEATKTKDPDLSVAALQFREYAANLIERFQKMGRESRRKNPNAPVEGQVTVEEVLATLSSMLDSEVALPDEEWEARKAQAEAEDVAGDVQFAQRMTEEAIAEGIKAETPDIESMVAPV